MNRRGFFSLLAGIAGAIGIGKVPWAGSGRSAVKSPPALSYDWKQLHQTIEVDPLHIACETQRELVARIKEKLALAARKEMEDGS